MFLKNSWYAAGWSRELTQDGLLSKRIINEPVLLYRKGDGSPVAMTDRCCHRGAALRLGKKEGDCIRCMYHGMKFDSHGVCVEIPGQERIPAEARVATFPVREMDGLLWVWMGEPARADAALIPRSPGPGHADWNIETGFLRFDADYRLIADNLLDFCHLTYVHRNTFGGTDAYENLRPTLTRLDRGIRVERVVRSVPPMPFAAHVFGGPEARIDMVFTYELHLPCVFIMQFDIHEAGTNTEGPTNGKLLLATRTTQAITPETEDSSAYYFSWGPSRATDGPGVLELMMEGVNKAFLEDKEMIEAQHQTLKAQPHLKMIPTVHDAALSQVRWLADRLLQEEQAA
jgi:vanillate O-demethylase monooxygenase subunit